MNIILMQCSMRLPVLLDQPLLGQNCVCARRRHRERVRDTARTSFVDADGVTDSWLGRTSTTGLQQYPPTGVARIAIAPVR